MLTVFSSGASHIAYDYRVVYDSAAHVLPTIWSTRFYKSSSLGTGTPAAVTASPSPLPADARISVDVPSRRRCAGGIYDMIYTPRHRAVSGRYLDTP